MGVVNQVTSGVPDIPTISGWVQVNTSVSTVFRTTLFRHLNTGSATGTLTIDFAGVTQLGCCWAVNEFDNVDTSGTNGSGAIVQSNTNLIAAGTSLSVTLGTFADATNNMAFLSMGVQENLTVVQEAGWTQLSNNGHNTPNNTLETQYLLGQDTSASASWTNSRRATAVAVEIRTRQVASGNFMGFF